jgi:hypothetical protein
LTGLLFGVLAVFGSRSIEGTMSDEDGTKLSLEPTNGTTLLPELPEQYVEVIDYASADDYLDPIINKEIPRAVRIHEIDRRIPTWVKQRWTPGERAGGVRLGPEAEIFEEHLITRRYEGVTLSDV